MPHLGILSLPGWMLASRYVVLLLWGGVAAMNYYPLKGVQAWNLKCRGLEQAGTWSLSQTFMRKKEIFKSERSLSRADLQVHLLSGDSIRSEDFYCL